MASRSCTTKPPPTRLILARGVARGEPFAGGDEPERGLGAQPIERARREAGRDDALEERLGEDLGRRVVDLAIEGDDAAERAHGVGFARRAVGVGEHGRRRDAAGVRVLDDDGRGIFELAHGVERGVHVDQVVEAELLLPAAEALGAAERAGRRVALAVEGARLVRVFAVAQRVALLEHDAVVARIAVRLRCAPLSQPLMAAS